MLKRLELIGFKSFADKTSFDFPAGITAIVGPNGSGKSNIVDAVRWILGEQSARSLRGGEMLDVIFNGSTSRKSLGMAEVVMTFDNARRILASDAEEVQVARRLYRDGTSEYLINNQLCRLKDIRDLFLGSGAGAGAYSIIEQGRVDGLLQASTTDRRVIFEEAAGISRFKAKKIETLRKLEKVDQNLSRIRDIFVEVDKQLRKVRLEASKAQKFQEYTERLKELSFGLSIREFERVQQLLSAESTSLETFRSTLSLSRQQTGDWESELRSLETSRTRLETALAEAGQTLGGLRQNIARFGGTAHHELQRHEEFFRELTRIRRRRGDLLRDGQNLFDNLATAENEVNETSQLVEQQSQQINETTEGLTKTEASLAGLQQQTQLDRIAQVDLVRQAGTLQTQAENARQQLERQLRERDSKRRRIEQRIGEIAAVERTLSGLNQADADLQQRLSGVRQNLAEKIQQREQMDRQADGLQQILEGLRVRRSDIGARIEVLEGLEKSQEGLGTGVREVMKILAQEPTGEFSANILGLVADVLTVPRDVAPLIDLALAEVAQCFIVRDAGKLSEFLSGRLKNFGGRVSFLPLSTNQPRSGPYFLAEDSADLLVTCEQAELSNLPRQLLGNTRLVIDLPTARQVASQPESAGFRFITRRGELLETDGRLTVGNYAAEAGILSRKSELRELRVAFRSIEREIVGAQNRLAELRSAMEALDGPIHSLEHEVELLNGKVGDLQTQLAQHKQQHEQLSDDIRLLKIEMTILEQEAHSVELAWHDASQRAEQAERAAQALRLRLEEAESSIRRLESERIARQEVLTGFRVVLAHTEERLTGLKGRFDKLREDARESRTELDRTEQHENDILAKLQQSGLASLNSFASHARLCSEKDTLEIRFRELSQQRDQENQRRQFISDALHQLRSTSRDQTEEIHSRELQVRDLENTKASLIRKLKEDYSVDLPELYLAYQALEEKPEIPEAEVAGREIQDLRNQIRRLGSVSLESLRELQEVEQRAKDLQIQIDDLTQSARALQEIIERINLDSRKLFGETFEAIRTQFQELFRKLFGGGMADILLENPEDILESGIEIRARPPGKELLSISLMSGGEKTMTAIALLLAIFRSRPSPFCLLDEVDAALDEANTARLAGALQEFRSQSQFIVITHKKRTMAAADVLYGITMQESGISKQIAVRFEDWEEKEERRAA